MTGVPEQRRRPSGLALGFFLGAAVALLAGALPTRWMVKRLLPPPEMAAIVVVSHDLPEGSLVTWDNIMQRSVPEGTFGPDVVDPDLAAAVYLRTVRVDQKAGEALRWSAFTPQEVDASCVELAEAALAKMDTDHDALRILKHLRVPVSAAPPAP
jgi:hypothetical protein